MLIRPYVCSFVRPFVGLSIREEEGATRKKERLDGRSEEEEGKTRRKERKGKRSDEELTSSHLHTRSLVYPSVGEKN